MIELDITSHNRKIPTIGQLVAEDFRTAEVFRKFGIDFCCGGKKPVDEACNALGISSESVWEALQKIKESDKPMETTDQEWKPIYLVSYIEEVHHGYTRATLPYILELCQKVESVHAERHPELVEIGHLLEHLSTDLMAHMKKEEMVLFPIIRKRIKGEETNAQNFSIRHPILVMEQEHDLAGSIMAKIRNLTGDYIPPPNACSSYRVLFQKLAEFEKDLHRHVHLENNVLFPQVMELEENPS